MKKAVSLLLTVVLILGVLFVMPMSASAASASNMKYELAFGVTQAGHTEKYSLNAYRFTVGQYTTFNIDYDTVDKKKNNKGKLFVIESSDYDNVFAGRDYKVYFSEEVSYGNETDGGYIGWYDGNMSLYAGEYYLIIVPGEWGTSNILNRNSNNYSISVTPTVTKLKKLTFSSSANAIKLKWTGDLGAAGYQVQREVSGSYKTLTNTTAMSYTDKSLKACTTYKYRVRGYFILNDKKYYGPWTNISATTVPKTPVVTKLATNTNHAVAAKWDSVACTGYQVQFSLKSNFSSSTASKVVSGAKSVTKSIKGKNGNVYYVRVRAYRKFNNKAYYSGWSAVKKIKCK